MSHDLPASAVFCHILPSLMVIVITPCSLATDFFMFILVVISGKVILIFFYHLSCTSNVVTAEEFKVPEEVGAFSK